MASARMKWTAGCLVALGALLLALGLTVGQDFYDLWRARLFERPVPVAYAGTSLDNLRSQHTALMLYHDSEGHFPFAAGWMDAIEGRLQTHDLKPGEGAKKLKYPAFVETPGAYGYAMNVAASGKFRDDVPEPDATILVFETRDKRRNAHGDPQEMAGNPAGAPDAPQGITVTGRKVTLRQAGR
jgi:hypothetical protein